MPMPLSPSQYREAPTDAERLTLARQYMAILTERAAANSVSSGSSSRNPSFNINQVMTMVQKDIDRLEDRGAGRPGGQVMFGRLGT
jgi:hypothetical protein